MIARTAFRATRLLRASPSVTSVPTPGGAAQPRNKDATLYFTLAALAGGTIGASLYFSKRVAIQPAIHKLESRHGPTSTTTTALCETIVPDVNLPEELHEQFNKFGKPQSEW